MTTTLRSSIWSLTMLNSSFNAALQIPRSSPSLIVTISLLACLSRGPGNCQVAVNLQVPSIRFASSMMLLNSTCSTLAILNCFFTKPVNCFLCGELLALTSQQFFVWCLLTLPCAMLCFRRWPIFNGSPVCVLSSVSSTFCCPLLLAVDDADFMSSLHLGFGSDSI